jgi:hypothetical protein
MAAQNSTPTFYKGSRIGSLWAAYPAAFIKSCEAPQALRSQAKGETGRVSIQILRGEDTVGVTAPKLGRRTASDSVPYVGLLESSYSHRRKRQKVRY